MKCLACGKDVDDDIKFCPYCGEKYSVRKEEKVEKEDKKEVKKTVKKVEKKVEDKKEVIDIKEINDNNLEEFYIQENYLKIKNKLFSLPTLLFGSIYFLYRKMYLLTVLYITLLVVLNYYFDNYIMLITLILHIIMSFLFNKIYLEKVEENINFIKKNNPDNYLDLIKKKGGISVMMLVIAIIVITFIFSRSIMRDIRIRINSIGHNSYFNMVYYE